MPEPRINTPVLVVEDDPVVASSHAMLVESCGYDVVAARDGEEALAELSRRDFRLVLSDWRMPVMDGLALCKAVRAMDRPHYAYFLLVTQRSERADYMEAMDAGVDDFIVKPLHRMNLYVRLRVAARILGFREAMDQINKLVRVCMHCGSIEGRQGEWLSVEKFLESRLERSVSHCICPDCFRDYPAGTDNENTSPGRRGPRGRRVT